MERNNCRKTHTCFISFYNGYWQSHGRQIQGNTHEKRCETTRETNSHNSLHMVLLESVTLGPLNSLLKKQEAYFSICGILYTPWARDSDCFTHNDIISHHVPLGWSLHCWPQSAEKHRPTFIHCSSIWEKREDRWSHRKSLKAKRLLCPGPYCANPKQSDFNEFLRLKFFDTPIGSFDWESPSSRVPREMKFRIWAQMITPLGPTAV